MDKEFLDKVVDQIVSETRIDYDKKEVYLPFFHSRPITVFRFLSTISPPGSFYRQCRDIYGLKKGYHESGQLFYEIDYVWEEYRNIIINKIENG